MIWLSETISLQSHTAESAVQQEPEFEQQNKEQQTESCCTERLVRAGFMTKGNINAVKTHRQESDVTVTMQMRINIRPAVAGVMKCLV